MTDEDMNLIAVPDGELFRPAQKLSDGAVSFRLPFVDDDLRFREPDEAIQYARNMKREAEEYAHESYLSTLMTFTFGALGWIFLVLLIAGKIPYMGGIREIPEPILVVFIVPAILVAMISAWMYHRAKNRTIEVRP